MMPQRSTPPAPPHPTPVSTLEAYLRLHDLSCHMVEAAQANDWDRLAALERDQATLRGLLPQLSVGNSLPTEAARIAQLIRQTLDNDAEVRRHVEPWMNSARKLLTTGRRGRAMRAAYTASGPR